MLSGSLQHSLELKLAGIVVTIWLLEGIVIFLNARPADGSVISFKPPVQFKRPFAAE